ncbi:helix-turn-helix transcriptional regulator [Planotetraspora kaengkrachanensis]|uniref:Transcriptional regulator n=2 Tax=Planotetraspora kaengkrachanensis TaxID=575193 RepID=A0A8J3Q031_9ACTN|nr:transcriptional regulator [Planotetraspora kaengkrachanensis]
MLAGVSVDYYSRLEQGRERNPSDQVLRALARALRLDAAATEHLYALAHPLVSANKGVCEADQVSTHVLRLIENMEPMSAFVVNHRLDILATNRVAHAIFEGFEYNTNLIRLTFLDPGAHEFWRNWDEEAVGNVAHLRAAAGANHDDPALRELIEELSRGSDEFRRLWERHDVQVRTSGFIRLYRSEVGEFDLWHEALRCESVPDLRIFSAAPEPGSPSESNLARLCAAKQADATSKNEHAT